MQKGCVGCAKCMVISIECIIGKCDDRLVGWSVGWLDGWSVGLSAIISKTRAESNTS